MFLRAPLLQSPPRRCCKNHTTVRGFPAAPANPFGGSTPLRLRRGTEGSNPVPSTGESGTNPRWISSSVMLCKGVAATTHRDYGYDPGSSYYGKYRSSDPGSSYYGNPPT